MIKIDCSVCTYNENLGKAYDSRLPKEDKVILRDYFSDFVTDCRVKDHPLPDKALKALEHINKSLHNIELQSKYDNKSHKPPMGKVITVICGLIVLIVWHYLPPYLP